MAILYLNENGSYGMRAAIRLLRSKHSGDSGIDAFWGGFVEPYTTVGCAEGDIHINVKNWFISRSTVFPTVRYSCILVVVARLYDVRCNSLNIPPSRS